MNMAKTRKENFKIIHLSDLHMGNSYSVTQGKIVPRHSIKQMIEIQKLVNSELPNLDRIIISGDVSDSGDKESLLLARQWIRNSLEIGNGAQISLGLPDHLSHILKIIPGNHDAYNYKKVKKDLQILYQESLANYNDVFVEDKIEENVERYDWIEKDGACLFIYYADTSFLGDSENEKPELKLLAKPAKGKLSVHKSEKLLETFDKGMRGFLHYDQDGSLIDKYKFRSSIKIIVMHHYLFEPVGYPIEPLLELSDKETVFANIAMADFDILLCGHKHISDVRDDQYIRHFDRRAKARYLINYFRRMLGIYSLPLQYKDKNGKKLSKLKSFFLSFNFLKQIEKNPSNDKMNLDLEYLEKINALILSGVKNPDKFDHYIKKFALDNKKDNIDEKELCSLAKTIRVDLSDQEKTELIKICANLKKMINNLSHRHFLQVMAGSACKNRQSKANSFNVYEVEPIKDGYIFHSRKYDWSDETGKFLVENATSYEFKHNNRPMH